jgi:hypothetical protein
MVDPLEIARRHLATIRVSDHGGGADSPDETYEINEISQQYTGVVGADGPLPENCTDVQYEINEENEKRYCIRCCGRATVELAGLGFCAEHSPDADQRAAIEANPTYYAALAEDLGKLYREGERAIARRDRRHAENIIAVIGAIAERELAALPPPPKPQPVVKLGVGQHWAVRDPDSWMGLRAPGSLVEITAVNREAVGYRYLAAGARGVMPPSAFRERFTVLAEKDGAKS